MTTPPSQPVRVAAVQMVSGTTVDANLRDAEALIAQAAAAGAELVALPEYFCLMGASDLDKVAAREADGHGPVQDFLAEQARRHALWLVGGTTPIATGSPQHVRNSVLVYDPQGARVARYDKIHLFNFRKGDENYDEARTIEPGRAVSSFTFTARAGGTLKVGLSVCYDLRFPELYRAMQGPDLILVPAAFTATTGRAHWTTLLKARAIENLCYVLAPAQGGRHANGRATYGHSMLVDPWGSIVDEVADGPGVAIGLLDPKLMAEVRTNLPALAHRVL
ncbi:MAG: carbon-nitrogen hydrolase family protein [Burkholderiaceae bacterium]|nr:carbon-nitrogen hydrolase family protein [Burkholderiaceae bacterium]